MKTYTITESQLQEIAGRLNSLTVQGIANSAQIIGITALLEQIAKPAEPEQSNVINLPAKDEAHG